MKNRPVERAEAFERRGFISLTERQSRPARPSTSRPRLASLQVPPSGHPRPQRATPGGPLSFGQLIHAAAARYAVDPALIAGVIETESGFDAGAVSPAGAKGLMQLMDGTARGLGVSNPFDAVQNVMGGARLLRQLLDRYAGSVPLALAAYNAGAGAVDRHGGVPPYGETQRYVPRALAAAQRYRAAAAQTDPIRGQGGR